MVTWCTFGLGAQTARWLLLGPHPGGGMRPTWAWGSLKLGGGPLLHEGGLLSIETRQRLVDAVESSARAFARMRAQRGAR